MNIVLAEDHPLFRSGVRGLLSMTADLRIIGEAATGEEAVRLAEELRPDLVLMDIRMPGINGVEAARLIRERLPATEVLMLTMHGDDRSVYSAMQAGAKGYVLKDAAEDELLQAIRMVGTGRAVFGTGIAERMMRYFAKLPDGGGDDAETGVEAGRRAVSAEAAPSGAATGAVTGAATGAVTGASREAATGEAMGAATGVDSIGSRGWIAVNPAFADLLPRELDILEGIASGETNADIAGRLYLSVKTVANNVTMILQKLQATSRHEARRMVVEARRRCGE